MVLNLFTLDLVLIIPGLFMILNLLVLILYSVFNSVKVFSRYLVEDVIITVSYILLLTVMLFANQITENWKCFNFYLSWDPLSNFSVIFLILIGIVVLISGYTYFKYENLFNFEFGILVYFYIIGVYLLFLSNDFFALYLAVELQSFVLYVLCAYKRDAFSSEAGLKYFVLGAFSSGLLLFGVSMIYGFTGTTNFDDLYSLFLPNVFLEETHSGILIGLMFFSVGFLFKLGVFPFHMWVPDAYEGAPTIVTTLLASLSKFAIAAAFIKIYVYVFFSFTFYWYRVFLVLGVLSVIFASIAAIYQDKIKRLLAYSGIAHMGYVLLALSSNSLEGLFAAYYYLIVYSLTSLAIFIILLSVRRYTNFLKLKTLSELSSLFRNNPPLAFSFSVLMFSMAGIPPLAGFFSKLFVFLSLLSVGNYLASTVVIVTSVVSAFYYLWIVKIIFFKDYPVKTYYVPISKINAQFLMLIVILNIFIFMFQNAVSIWLINLIFSWYF
jgi:NADH-quinone oxidoreductase subunit N